MKNLTEIQTAIDEYLIAIRQAQYSQATQEKYGWHLKRMNNWCAEHGITRLENLSKTLVRKWGAELYDYIPSRTGKPWAPATVKQAVAAARSFFRWCREEEMINEDLAKVLKLPKVEKEPQRTLDVIEAWTTINACDPSSIKGIRDRALISLMVDSGLRASEVCRLCVDDLVFGVQLFDPLSGTLIEVNQIIVVRKRGKKGDAYFGPETADWVRAWLKARDSVVKHSGIKELRRFGISKPAHHPTLKHRVERAKDVKTP